MDKLLQLIINFFQNKSIHFGLRTSLFIISIFLLSICDYHLNFTYDIHLNNKIEKLESINNLKKIYRTDSLKFLKMTELENQVYKRRHYLDRFRNLNLNQINIFKKSDTPKIKKPVINTDNTIYNKQTRSLFWMILTSSYFLIGLIIVLIIMPFTSYVHRQSNNIIGNIALIILIFGIIYLLTWIAYKIPLILDKPYLNYVLNFLIHSYIIYLIFFRLNKTEKN
tara:strand:- start:127 stop:798 length:672 start_codon:yes stop_codon:yes gene_type:complete